MGALYVPEEHTFYKKFFQVGVYDANKKQKPLIWRSLTHSVDEDGDLRAYSDFLLIRSFKWFGNNTYGTSSAYMYEDDPEVALLRNAYMGNVS